MMNFKIELNYLNIDNYPTIESHLEKMARKGWLLHKIFVGTLFIYKKIEPQAIEVSISPYEVETAFTRKRKEDLDEFHWVSEIVGWNYATKSYDLHIYYKKKDTEAMPIHTDADEEFRLLERIAKRYLGVQYVALPLLLFLTWAITGSMFTSIRTMKDGYIQLLALLLPFALVMSLIHIIDLRKFIKRNRANIEQGKSLYFNSSKQWLYKLIAGVFYVVLVALVIYLIYSAFVIKNLRSIIVLSPLVVGGIIGLMYRAWIKPLRTGLGFKVGSFLATVVLGALVGIPLGRLNFNLLTSSSSFHQPEYFRVLTYNDLLNKDQASDGLLTRDASILIPKSYEYRDYFENEITLTTEYSHALTESVADNLVEAHIQNTKNALRGQYGREVEDSFNEGVYHPALASSGLTAETFYTFYNKDANAPEANIWDEIEASSITDARSLWEVEAAYFLNAEKNEIILREGTEVFYLAGIDFSDPTIIAKTKTRLELN